MSFELDIAVQREDGKATVTGRVFSDGVEVPIAWPIVIVNPPEKVPDGVDDEGRTVFRLDPDEAVREVVRDVARGVTEG